MWIAELKTEVRSQNTEFRSHEIEGVRSKVKRQDEKKILLTSRFFCRSQKFH